MKRILIFTLVFLLILSSLFSCANNNAKETEDSENESITEKQTEKEKDRLPAQIVSGEGFEYVPSEDNTYYIFKSKGTCADEKITVPAEFSGLPVKAIAENAFIASEGIKEITVSEGITEIGKNAFAFSKELQKVTLPSTLTEVPERLCYSCPKLDSVTFGSTTSVIGDSAFENCTSLTAITLSDSIKSIGSAAFYNCTALSDIKLGGSLERIKYSAFDKTAFAENAQNWQNKTLYIGQYLIKVSDGITGELDVKEGTLLIADHAAKRTNITAINFPSSIKFIGAASFTACLSIKSIDLPEGTVAIYDEAFSSCDGITEANLPDSLTVMGELAFYHCSSLQEITIPKGITVIPNQAFNECASIKKINFHDNVKEIGVYSFANCHSIVKITFPNSITAIEESAFYKCYNLVSINLPRNLAKLGNWAFQYCNKLLDVKNESMFNITVNKTENGYAGKYAMEIHKGESKIKEIDSYLFYSFNGTNYLIGYVGADTSITLPESMNGESYTVYKYAFCYNTKLEKISLPAGADAIQSNAFETCAALTELTLGKSVKTIAKNAVNNCPEFKKVSFLGTEAEFGAINVTTPNTLFINAEKSFVN